MPECSNGKRFLELSLRIASSRSISELHMTPDYLGVRVPELRFRTAAGAETR